MVETLHGSSDAPNFGPYPSSSHSPHPLDSTGPPRGEGKRTLEQYAIQVGGAVGRAVVKLREARAEMQELASETGEMAVARMEELASTARSKVRKWRVGDWRDRAVSGAEDLGHAAAQGAGKLRSRTKAGYEEMKRDYPVQAIVAACAVGLALGIGLRIWRSNRANS